MKMKHTKILISALLLICSATFVAQAQGKAGELLRKLQFEAPKALYKVKGKTANVREAASTSAKKASLFNRWRDYVSQGILLGDMGDKAGWITFRTHGENVYVSKSVLKEVPSGPIFPSIYNQSFGWVGPEYGPEEDPEDLTYWRVGVQSGGAGLAVCELYYFGDISMLLLGKKIGNIFVFKYAVPCLINTDANIENKPYIIEGNLEEGYNLIVSDKFCTVIKGESYDGMKRFDLTKATDAILYQLFHEVIEKDIQTHYFINSTMLGGEYANYMEHL